MLDIVLPLKFWDTPQFESTYSHTWNQNERRNEGKRKINQTTPLLFCFVLFQFLVFRRLFILFHCISFSSFLFVLLRLCLSFKPKWQQQLLAEAEALKNLSIPLFILHLSFKFVYFISFCTFKEISLTLSFISSPKSIAFCVLCFAIFYQYLCIILSG